MLNWLDKNPWIWGYVVIPIVGWILSLVAPAIATRWPRAGALLEWLMHKLPAAQSGSFEKLRAARRPALPRTNSDSDMTPVIIAPPRMFPPPSTPPKGES